MVLQRADSGLDVFERHRSRLFGIAYRMLGSVEDAEDVLQESYLRWHGVDPAELRSAEAWLVTVTTRLAIDRLRRTSSKREHYPGTWLPEPVATGRQDAADRRAEMASDLSLAFLLILERLGPEERAAFLLREVFDVGYGDISRILDRSEAACRQMVHRARARVRADRPRFAVPRETRERLLDSFLAALEEDDPEAMLQLVTADVMWIGDGGGKVPATRRIVRGADAVVRLILGFERKGRGVVRHTRMLVNGDPAIATFVGDRLLYTTSFDTDGDRILAFYRILDPDKLRSVAAAMGAEPFTRPA